MHYLAIFLPNNIVTGMPYLPAKDELVSLDRLSSRGLWKWYNSKGFGPATIWRGAAFHFLAVFSKMKILWKLWLSFSKMFHQRVFPDWKWSISKFQFWRQILDIYRQRLLSHISRQFENLEIYRDLYGKPFKHDWVAIKSCFSHTNPSNFRRLLLRYTAENSQVT